jgi:hypothetical protein
MVIVGVTFFVYSSSKKGHFGVWGSLVVALGEACYDTKPQVCGKSCDREETVSLFWVHV